MCMLWKADLATICLDVNLMVASICAYKQNLGHVNELSKYIN